MRLTPARAKANRVTGSWLAAPAMPWTVSVSPTRSRVPAAMNMAALAVPCAVAWSRPACKASAPWPNTGKMRNR
jgi:hypothetical protein